MNNILTCYFYKEYVVLYATRVISMHNYMIGSCLYN